MLVISDTSCLSALIQTGHLHLLRDLYQEVTIPPVVYDELAQLAGFGVDTSILTQSFWLKVQSPLGSTLLEQLLHELHEGEAQAIALAIELDADLLIADDFEARKTAKQLGLPITGPDGVLLEAKRQSLVLAVKPLLDDIIESAGFYLNQRVYARILELAGE
jgi:hypothetical protein